MNNKVEVSTQQSLKDNVFENLGNFPLKIAFIEPIIEKA